jgi:hypothetical protein
LGYFCFRTNLIPENSYKSEEKVVQLKEHFGIDSDEKVSEHFLIIKPYHFDEDFLNGEKPKKINISKESRDKSLKKIVDFFEKIEFERAIEIYKNEIID